MSLEQSPGVFLFCAVSFNRLDYYHKIAACLHLTLYGDAYTVIWTRSFSSSLKHRGKALYLEGQCRADGLH